MPQTAAANPRYVEADDTPKRSTTGGGAEDNADNSSNDPIESSDEKREKEAPQQGGLGSIGVDLMKDWSKAFGKAGEWTLESINFKNGDLQVGLKSKSGTEVARYSIKSVVMTRDADGKPHAELEFYGRSERSKLW
jgi:hypothetical protein